MQKQEGTRLWPNMSLSLDAGALGRSRERNAKAVEVVALGVECSRRLEGRQKSLTAAPAAVLERRENTDLGTGRR